MVSALLISATSVLAAVADTQPQPADASNMFNAVCSKINTL